MRIAQVAPLYESVPPKQYGGTERIVSYLTEALVRQGHEVTLFASGDSETSAELVPIGDQSLRASGSRDPLAQHLVMLEKVFRRDDFDLVHFHVDYMHFPLTRRHSILSLTTLHGRLDFQELGPLYREYSEMPLISISLSQRLPLRWARWVGNVYHGLPRRLYRPFWEPGKYLAFLGRVSPEKGLDRAIDIAEQSGIPLKIAAKIDPTDAEYFEEKIKPRLKSTLIEFIGEIGEREKNMFLGNALALVFPIDWPEPFGIVMIEAMACGTPVVAFGRGSVYEIIEDGLSGFVIHTVDQAVEALNRISTISRRSCRERFETRFLDTKMSQEYSAIYSALLRPSFGSMMAYR